MFTASSWCNVLEMCYGAMDLLNDTSRQDDGVLLLTFSHALLQATDQVMA